MFIGSFDGDAHDDVDAQFLEGETEGARVRPAEKPLLVSVAPISVDGKRVDFDRAFHSLTSNNFFLSVGGGDERKIFTSYPVAFSSSSPCFSLVSSSLIGSENLTQNRISFLQLRAF